MISVSEDFLEAMEEHRNFTYSAEVVLADGSELLLDEDLFCATGCRIVASPGTSSFPVGNLISRCLTLAFHNYDGEFAQYDFMGAVVTLTASLELDSDRTETISLGSFTVTEPETYGTTISIVAYDNGWKTDQVYTTALVFPVTAQVLYRDCCSRCNFIQGSSAFRNNDYLIMQKPEGLTCRQIFGKLAMLAGGNAVISGNTVEIVSYADQSAGTVQELTEVIKQKICTDPVTITGVTLTHGEDVYSVGSSVYALSLTNELTNGNESDAATRIGLALIGLTFRPFELTTPSYPIAEFADPCGIEDAYGTYTSFITDIDFTFKGTTTIKCSADSPIRNSTKGNISDTPAIRQLRQLLIEEKSSRELAEAELADALAEKAGLFSTIETDQSGSSVYYFHDQPTLAASQIVWKMTREAWGVSTNGGRTWNAGMTVDGETIVNILQATGINADWITAGSFEVTDGQGRSVFIADVDTGSVYISGDRVFVGNTSVTDALAQLSNALTIVLSNETQGIPVDSDGDYSTFPDVATEIRVIYGGTDVSASCTLQYNAFNVSGSLSPYDGHYKFTPTALDADTGYVTFWASYQSGLDTYTASMRFNLYKVYAGPPGPAGQDGLARLYFIDPDTDIIKQGEDGVFKPSEITFSAFYRDGNEETRHAYAGLFKVEVTTDGQNWETVEEPIENKTYTTYTPEDGIAAVRCYLYSAAELQTDYYGFAVGDTTTVLVDGDDSWLEADEQVIIISGGDLLDIQSTAIVKDVSALTQDSVFDVLTNGGEAQGLYLYNGRVYLNAAYMATGVLRSASGGTYWNLDTGQLFMGLGSVGGFTTDGSSIRTAAASSSADNSIALTTADFTRTINGISRAGLRFALGDKFGVTGDGKIYASEATISGAITATSLTLGSGVTVPYSKVSDKPNLSVYVQKDGTIGSTPAEGATGFKVSSAGLLTASNAVIYGTLYSTSGKIARWDITNGAISKTCTIGNYQYRPVMQAIDSPTANSIAFGIGRRTAGSTGSYYYPYCVTYDGKLWADECQIKGAIEATSLTLSGNAKVPAAKISGTLVADQINISKLSNLTSDLGNITAGSIKIGENFEVRSDGTLIATDAGFEGQIGAEHIGVESMYCYNTTSSDRRVAIENGEIEVAEGWSIGLSSFLRGTETDRRFEVLTDHGTELFTDETYNRLDLYGSAVSIMLGNTEFLAAVNRTIIPEDNFYYNVNTKPINAGINIYAATYINGNMKIAGSLSVTRTKQRIVETPYGEVALAAYETPTPYFGDIGTGKTDERGECIISIDPIFAETISGFMEYVVFLQAETEGNLYIAEKHPDYFVVRGDPNVNFAWELKAAQKGYEYRRLEASGIDPEIEMEIEDDDELQAFLEEELDPEDDFFDIDLKGYDKELDNFEYEMEVLAG